MNNLLRTLTDSRLAQEPDLKLLLNNVKEARKQSHDNRHVDAFYDSLDGLLQDLRQVTMDNRDAEAFLKPVSKTEVPDYYDVIMHPMDLQTMQKKVKQKAYKSKREFKDDLDLIWSNCFTYNATENHPLRQCAMRLKAKAEKLLKNITDRRERQDPPIPSDVSRGGTPKLNGNGVNGHAVARPRSIAFTKSPSPSKPAVVTVARRDAQFPDQPAIVRTAEGMAEWAQLDRELDARLQGELLANGSSGPSVEERLRAHTGHAEAHDEDAMSVDGEVGEKRKLSPGEGRPRKRARTGTPEKDVVELWWDAMQTDALIGNGLPALVHAASEPADAAPAPSAPAGPPRRAGQRPRKKRRKQDERAQKTLLGRMNENIRTLRRVRDVHARLAVLKESADDPAGGDPPLPPPPPLDDLEDPVDDRPWRVPATGVDVGERNADECMHWMSRKVLEHAGFQGTSKVALDVLAGVASDYLLNVGRTLHFLTEKYAQKMTPEEIILHTLFESGVTRAPYDLERYIKEDIVRYGSRMSDLEKKLNHTYSEATADMAWDDEALFGGEENEEEEGEFVMGNFADAFGEDFLGLRELGIAAEFGLASLSVPKKLLKSKGKGANAPGAASAKKPSEPPPPFPPPPPFVPLDSRAVEDQIGLLRPFYQHRIAQLAVSAAPAPPPSAPSAPLPPFNPTLPGSHAPPRPFPQAPYTPALAPPSAPPEAPPPPPPVTLPDDPPSPAHTKLGPLGQVLKPSGAAGAAKKKDKAPAKGRGPADGAPPVQAPGLPPPPGTPGMFAGLISMLGEDGTPAATPVATAAPETPKKPKPTPTKKKKGQQQVQGQGTLEALPPPILASG